MFKSILMNLLKENRLTQKALAEQTGIPTSTINNWIKRDKTPDLNALTTLADYFDCSIDYLTGHSDDFGNIQYAEPKENLTARERELLKKYRAISADGKEKAFDFVDLLYRDEERKRTPRG